MALKAALVLNVPKASEEASENLKPSCGSQKPFKKAEVPKKKVEVPEIKSRSRKRTKKDQNAK